MRRASLNGVVKAVQNSLPTVSTAVSRTVLFCVVSIPNYFQVYFEELDQHLFGEGTHLRLFEKMGAHPQEIDGVLGTRFSVWAPNAKRVSVVCDFNG